MSALPKLLEDTRRTTARLASSRVTAHQSAARAIRKLERALIEALAGEKLRDMPELGGARFARVRGRIDAPLIIGKETLVVSADGELEMVTLGRLDGMTGRRAEEDDFLAEDVEAYSAVVEEVLRRHLAAAQRSAERFDRLRELADRLHETLLAEFVR